MHWLRTEGLDYIRDYSRLAMMRVCFYFIFSSPFSLALGSLSFFRTAAQLKRTSHTPHAHSFAIHIHVDARCHARTPTLPYLLSHASLLAASLFSLCFLPSPPFFAAAFSHRFVLRDTNPKSSKRDPICFGVPWVASHESAGATVPGGIGPFQWPDPKHGRELPAIALASFSAVLGVSSPFHTPSINFFGLFYFFFLLVRLILSGLLFICPVRLPACHSIN
jgi:hypothetical protein